MGYMSVDGRYDAYMSGVDGSNGENVELHPTTLPVDEVDLIDRAFHGAANERRWSLDQMRGGGGCPPLAAKIKDELKNICNRSIQLVGRFIEQSTDTELTVTLKKMLADHHRYLAEITNGDANSHATENARLTYREAAAIARATLPSHSNIRCGMEIERYHRGWSRSRSRSRSSDAESQA